MAQKIILGVNHQPNTLENVKKAILGYRPVSVGLELTEDYAQKIAEGDIEDFFYPLHLHLSENGIRTYPLESPELRNSFHVVSIAIYLYTRYYKLLATGFPNLRHALLESVEERFLSGSADRPWIEDDNISVFRKLFEILDKAPSTIELHEMFMRANADKEVYMAERTEFFHPELICVGSGHGPHMAELLPDYRYVDLFPD